MQEKISKRIDVNIAAIEGLFDRCGDVVKRKLTMGAEAQTFIYIVYIDGLTSRQQIEEGVVQNLVIWSRKSPERAQNLYGGVLELVKETGMASADIQEVATIDEVTKAVMSGDCAIFIDGAESAVILSAKGWPSRGISEADSEKVIQGSKDAFSESLRVNTALIRRRIRDTRLKLEQSRIGRRSQTDIALVYMDDIVREDILNKVKEKLRHIDIDAILDAGYIEQFLEDERYSPFPQTQVTERPDTVAASVLEGRIAIIVDNSPFVILVPVTINGFFQSAEDYYQRFEIMSFLRLLRYVAAFIAVGLSGLYLAMTVYHPAMLPAALTLKMAASRQSVPFPAVGEILIMELAFELLREAGVRLPGVIGGTLGIVGGLIVGQAAVEAGIVSPVVVIIVALGGIASFSIPQQPLVNAFRLVKFYVILLSAALGLFGFWVGMLSVLTHVASLKSFGIPYTFPLGCSDMETGDEMRDTLIRFPLSKMKKRPFFANPGQKIRLKTPNKRGE